ncbi:Major Facilitator Superfamily protein [Halorientalis persicus]|uniref:Major Facilitator Superfamily protein n=1 Tax=Halorientalis persicus TaxID=1367881 RepID=A0A1H8LD48_9EURY|nr:MFS transporter [Halorientalis persicus]SEO02668.1 Major Facilitator Superfamily protein [Halorientalis persicus]
MADAAGETAVDDGESALGTLRAFFALERDVLVLSVAMFAFSLGFQMTGRYVPRYMSLLGAGGLAIGLYGTVGNLISAVYPYPGGAVSDRIGSRLALTAFGLASTVGFLVWVAAPLVGTVTVDLSVIPLVTVEAVVLPVGIFLGLFLAQAWKSFGLGATFAVVKQAVPPERLATGFASTETVRRLAFLVGPLLAAALIAVFGFDLGFRAVLLVAAAFGLVATVVQHVLYDASEDTVGKSFEGISAVAEDLRSMPPALPPLLAGDTLVRFANGMVYVFFVIVVTEFLAVDATLPLVGYLSPDALFGVLLAVEMMVALASMVPMARLADRVGLKPVVALGFSVYAIFPILLINAPADPVIVGLLFAFSGFRFAGLPAHKALIVGPAEQDAGGRVTGAYYLLRNTLTIPSALVGGYLYDAVSPELAFGVATAIGLVGTGVFLVFGREFDP